MSTAAAKTHGMDRERVDPDWPEMTLAEMRALLAQFPTCGVPEKILFVSPRPFSAASVVATSSGRVFIKRHHRTVRDREGLLEEHRFLAHLANHGAPVPRIFATVLGETAIEIGEWTYEVHEAREGVDIYEDALSWTPFLSTAHARSAGQALARLHLASQGFDAPRRKTQPLVASFTIFESRDPRTAMEDYLAARPVIAGNAVARQSCEEAIELLAPFFAELKLKLSALQSLWTHNDLHASNLLWSDASKDAQVAAIIDFGLADRTNAVHDLAQAIERNIVEWLDLDPASTTGEEVRVHLDQLEALLDGYDSLRPLTSDEAAALASMTALCHAEFALSEADYFLSVLHSEEKMRVALLDYLIGHARWFRSAGGTKLLNAIRQRKVNREHRMAAVGANR
jgi:Ser/Thr protein kinase RdoA (MazF antagonist)